MKFKDNHIILLVLILIFLPVHSLFLNTLSKVILNSNKLLFNRIIFNNNIQTSCDL